MVLVWCRFTLCRLGLAFSVQPEHIRSSFLHVNWTSRTVRLKTEWTTWRNHRLDLARPSVVTFKATRVTACLKYDHWLCQINATPCGNIFCLRSQNSKLNWMQLGSTQGSESNLFDSNSKEQIPSSEANGVLASQEIPWILWNPKVHYRIHKSSSLAFVLSHINPIHAFLTHFFKSSFNIVLHPRLGFQSALFPWVFSTKSVYTFFLLLRYVSHAIPVHPVSWSISPTVSQTRR